MSIAFGSYIIRTFTWAEWKAVQSAKNLITQYNDEGTNYTVYGYDGPEVLICTIWKGELSGGVLQGGLTQEQADSDLEDFETNYKPKANRSLSQRTKDGKDIVSSWPTEGNRVIQISPNWCDKTSWFFRSVHVVDEVALCQNSGTWSLYSVVSGSLIDSYHGKISNEDYIVDSQGNSCRVVVKVNDVVKTEQDPHFSSGGDYVVNYMSGTLLFNPPLLGTDTVKVTYNYATTSEWSLKADPGKILKIKRVEAQFSSDVVISDSIVFQPYVFGFPYGDKTTYKTMMDFINEANGNYSPTRSLGITGNPKTDWRNIPKDIITFPWDYQALMELKSSYQAEVRIMLEHNVPFGGNAATATFYCFVEDE